MNVNQTNVALAPFDSANICPIQSSPVGEFFLRKAQAATPLTNYVPELYKDD